ncbi:MAG: hypothetical protein H0T73_11510 [Ardenticatenales bacterium]|nr:hypothetical protein [Ardenticatenales bacterium]
MNHIYGRTSRVTVSGPYAYVAADTGIYVLDYVRQHLYIPLFSDVGDRR